MNRGAKSDEFFRLIEHRSQSGLGH